MMFQDVKNFLPLWWRSRKIWQTLLLITILCLINIMFSNSNIIFPSLKGNTSLPFRSFTIAIAVAVLTRAIYTKTSFDCADTGCLQKTMLIVTSCTIILGTLLFTSMEYALGLPFAPSWASTFSLLFCVSTLSLNWITIEKLWIVPVILYLLLAFLYLPETYNATWHPLAFTHWSPLAITIVVLSMVSTPLIVLKQMQNK